MKIRFLLFWLAFYLIPNISYAGNIKFYHLNYEQGLSQSTVNCIIKDNRGYFWFGTNDGLNKWDGYTFTVYSNDENNPGSIGQGRINAFYEDDEDNLWIGTSQGGLCKYNPEYNSFENYLLSKTENNNPGINNIIDIAPFDGKLLLATFSGELFMFEPNTFEFSKVALFDENNNLLQHLIFNRLYVDEENVVWIGCSQGAIKTRNFTKQGRRAFMDGTVFLPGKDVYEVYTDKKNNIWFGTYKSGVYRLNIRTNQMINFSAKPQSGNSVNHSNIRTICEDREGKLWMGTGGGGINIFDYENDKFTYYKPELNNPFAVGSNIIYVIYPDEDKNLWIGTYNGGVSYTNKYKQRFNHERSFGKERELSHNSILSFCEAPNGELWLGTDGGGVNIYNPLTESYRTLSSGNKLKVVTSMEFNGKNEIYLGTYREGLYVYNLKTRSLRNYNVNSNSLPNNDVWDIEIAGDGKVWIGTLGGGVTLFDENTGEFFNIKDAEGEENFLEDPFVSSLLLDSEKNLWIGTYHKGLFKLLDASNGLFEKVTGENPLGSSEVRTVFQDKLGQIWVGTQDGGLNLYLGDEMGFRAFRKGDGLAGNTVQAIQEDNEGNLWLSTNSGLSKMSVTKGEYVFRNYSANDGLQANEFNINASLKDKSGRVYFGGINGYNSFLPEEIIDDLKPAGPVVIRSLKLNDILIEPGDSESVISKSVEFENSIKIGPKYTTITLEFAMLDYSIPENNTYRYRLFPFDEEWINAGNRRRVTYTNLDPGSYQFQLIGINSQLKRSDETASLNIDILPPYWKTMWFRFMLIFMLLLFLFSIYFVRVKSLRVQGEILKELVDDRTKELISLNQVLEDRNKEVFQQSEELKKGQEELIAANKSLETNNKEIESQKIELEERRKNLEKTIRSRTFELEMAKRKAEESEQLKMAFLSNMSHEIRTPMNAIVGFASLLADFDLSQEQKEEYANQINVNSESLLLLIDDILDLSKIEANQLRINLEKFEVNHFFNQLQLNWQHIQTGKNSNVEFATVNELSNNSLYINSDEQRIRQILNNLLDNAFKFTTKGKVKLVCKQVANKVEFSVSDTGIGVSEEDQNFIFDRFRKGEDSSKKLYRGAGLGLTISHKLTELIDGKIWVESIEGKGSVFYLSIPVYEAEQESFIKRDRKREPDIDIDLNDIKVLIAEDEEANFFYLSGVLKKKGAIVDHAVDGEEAIKMSAIKNYDLILMDIKMPNVNGLEATQKIKMMFPHQIIVAQTAFARPEEEAEFRKKGFDGYITKPIKNDALFSVIKSLIEK